MNTVVLLGPKHSGKTSAGSALAKMLGYEFADLDELIEKRTGKSVRSLYKEGVLLFRNAETQALTQALANKSNSVIAAGGGVIDNEDAVALLKETPVSIVYLEVSAKTAWERVKMGELPAFLNTDTPEETHRILHTRRAAAYKKICLYTVDADGKAIEEIVRELTGIVEQESV
jgi:shikimate kinase